MIKTKSIFSSLRLRLTLWYVAVMAVVLVTFSAILYTAVERSQQTEFENTLWATSDIIKTKVQESAEDRTLNLDPNEIPIREELFIQTSRLTSATRAVVMYQSPNLSNGDPLRIGDAAQQALSRGQKYFNYEMLPNGKRVAIVYQVYGLNIAGGFPYGVLQVAAPFTKVEQTLSQLQFWLWIVVPITLVLTSFGGIFLADRLLRPLAQMNMGARDISDKKLNRRLPVANPNDELGQLALTLNDLFDRLESAFKNQQRFIADASHELRTPMAAMRAEIEVALRRERETQEYKNLIHSNLDEVKRLSRMAERLLFLTQSDAGKLPLQDEPVALDDICRQVLDMLTPLAKQQQLCLSLEDVMPTKVCGDGELLKQLIIILTENAIKYTPEGGSVRVSCGEHVKEAWLSVEDSGQGIPKEHIPHLFERFYRVDKARSREYGGTGLGLAIAHSIVFAHQGRIEVDSVVGGGTTFRIYLPFS